MTLSSPNPQTLSSFKTKLRYPALKFLALFIQFQILIPKATLAEVIGFTGVFADNWNPICAAYDDPGCGYIFADGSARVNSQDSTLEAVPNFTYWTNSTGSRTSDYTISFDADFVNIFQNDFPGYGFYQIGSGSPVTFESTASPTSLVLPSQDNLTFGIYLSSPSAGGPGVANLTISNFSATPFTPVTAPLVPAPLPAIGAASLFLGSRRLKKRMVRQRVLRLARRNLAPALRSVLPG